MVLETMDALRHGYKAVAYELHRSPRRRTLSIEVHRDLRVIVRAPARADERFIRERVRERSHWIERTLERLRRAGHVRSLPLQYVEGETHHVLGAPCTLRIRRAAITGVTLAGAELQLGMRGTPTPARVRRALCAWYREQGGREVATILAERFGWFAARGHRPPAVAFRAMRSRWGSLVAGRRMTLNLALVRAPRECLEYVVVHELCHLEHRGHGPRFYRLMDQLLPDWRERRRRLELALPGAAG